MKYDFCKFKNSSAEKAELFFYGDIVSESWEAFKPESQYPLNVLALLKDIGDRDIDIHINSGGGDVFAGFTIHNMLRSTKGKKTVYIDGNAASIASVIAMAGDEIIMPSNAFLMIHKASAKIWGNSEDMLKAADVLEKLDASIIESAYMRNATEGVTEENFKKMMEEETWLNSTDAKKYFKNIKTVEPVAAAASIDSKFVGSYKNMPDLKKVTDAIGKPSNANIPPELQEYANFSAALKIGYDL